MGRPQARKATQAAATALFSSSFRHSLAKLPEGLMVVRSWLHRLDHSSRNSMIALRHHCQPSIPFMRPLSPRSLRSWRSTSPPRNRGKYRDRRRTDRIICRPISPELSPHAPQLSALAIERPSSSRCSVASALHNGMKLSNMLPTSTRCPLSPFTDRRGQGADRQEACSCR